MRFVFDWDPRKAENNRAKHGASFNEAMTVFQDRRALTIFDDDHSEAEERRLTVGMSSAARHLFVVHTHVEMTRDEMLIRIISARRPTRNEVRQYNEGIAP